MMTKRQKQIQAHRDIKKIILNEFTYKVLKDLETTINSIEKDSGLLEYDNESIKNDIVKKYSLNGL